jgi:hypothetical protein
MDRTELLNTLKETAMYIQLVISASEEPLKLRQPGVPPRLVGRTCQTFKEGVSGRLADPVITDALKQILGQVEDLARRIESA